MKHCLGEIMGGKAHKMIIQYVSQNYERFTKIYGDSVTLEFPVDAFSTSRVNEGRTLMRRALR